jgi:hypothetical protein
MRYWSYLKTYSVTRTYEDGTKEVRYPLASVMSEMKPLLKVTPSKEMTHEREACTKAFALACRYSEGWDLVEEMVVSDYWPLGKRNLVFHIELVNVPVYGPTGGVPFPQFDHELPAIDDKKAFAAEVEEGARLIVRKISHREYLAQKVVGGTMPWLNRVLEELGIHHEEHEVPTEVLTTIEQKRKKVIAKNATAAVESKKRKRIGASQVVGKKQKVSTSGPASAASSISGSGRASADAVEVSVENSSGGPTEAVVVAEEVGAPKDAGDQRVEGADPPEPSANPMPFCVGWRLI